MTMLFLLPIVALGLIVVLGLMTIKSTKPFVSKNWQNQREYDRFVREHGKWQVESLWSVP